MPLAVFLKSRQQSGSVLTIHYVNDENDVRLAQISFNGVPLVFVQHCAEVVCRNTQIERVRAIDPT